MSFVNIYGRILQAERTYTIIYLVGLQVFRSQRALWVAVYDGEGEVGTHPRALQVGGWDAAILQSKSGQD